MNISYKLSSINFHENPFNISWCFTQRQTDKRIHEMTEQAIYRDANVPIHCTKEYNTPQFIKIKVTAHVRPTLLKRTKKCHLNYCTN